MSMHKGDGTERKPRGNFTYIEPAQLFKATRTHTLERGMFKKNKWCWKLGIQGDHSVGSMLTLQP